MRLWWLCLALLGGAVWAQKPRFALAPPALGYSSAFFADSVKVELRFAEKGCHTRYTLDGTEPTEKSPVYKGPLVIRNTAVVKARNFGEGFLPSETVAQSFIRLGMPLSSVQFSTPSPQYAGQGPGTLNDGKGGKGSHSQPGWLGYSTDSVVIDVRMAKAGPVKQIMLDILNTEGAWIFPPDSIRVLSGGKTIAGWKPSDQPLADGVQQLTIPVKWSTPVQDLRLLVYPVKQIRADHPGAGQRGWWFVDEVLVF